MAIVDVLYTSVAIFALIIVFGAVFYLQGEIFPKLEERVDINNTVTNQTLTSAQAVFPLFDIMLTMAFFAGFLTVIILAAFLPTSPVLIGVTVVAMAALFITTPVLSNVFLEYSTKLAPYTNMEVNFPYMFFIMENYPLFVMEFTFLLFIILVVNFRRELNV
jgi:hypothetical protein